VAEKFGVDLHEIEIAPQVLDLLPKMTYHLDEPIGDPAAINTFLICSAAREAGVKVMLSGMGADELFAGYRKHLANLIELAVPQGSRCGLRRPVGPWWTAAGGLGQARLPVGAVREAVPVLRGPARGDGVPAQLHDVRPRRAAALVNPDLAPDVDDVLTEHATSTTTRRSTTSSTGCAWPTRGCSCPG
jgi:asparagine synthase (glutamine-hydrolysing)